MRKKTIFALAGGVGLGLVARRYWKEPDPVTETERGQIAEGIAEIDRQIAALHADRRKLVWRLDGTPEEPTLSPQEAAAAWLDELRSPPSADEAGSFPELPTVVYPGGHRYERVEIARDEIPPTCSVWIFTGRETPEAHLASALVPFREVTYCGASGPPGDWWSADRKDMDERVELCATCARERGRRLPGT